MDDGVRKMSNKKNKNVSKRKQGLCFVPPLDDGMRSETYFKNAFNRSEEGASSSGKVKGLGTKIEKINDSNSRKRADRIIDLVAEGFAVSDEDLIFSLKVTGDI